MNQPNPAGLTPEQIRRLPPDQRDAVLSAAAELAVELYQNDPALTAFEAFGEGDLYGESSSSETRRDLAG